jgi:threonine dehydrogenase-like Zn-dependent dehydrogenase
VKAVRIHGPRVFSVDEVDIPALDAVDALVRVEACGICGSDLAYIEAGATGFGRKSQGASVLGHEAAGEVIAVGSGVSTVSVGDRVAINPIDRRFGATIGNGGPEGALSEVLRVRNAADPGRLVKLPEGMSARIGALAEPMGVALHTVNRSGATAGSKVVVLGVGPIGLGTVIWLKHRAVEHVVAVDLSTERLDRARRFGADAVIRAGEGNLAEQLVALHGQAERGRPATDTYIDAAGAPAALNEVVSIARLGSRVTVVAVYKAPVPIDLSTMLHKEMALVTSLAYPTELGEVVEFLGANADRMGDFISDVFPLVHFEQAVDRARQSTGAKVMIQVSG